MMHLTSSKMLETKEGKFMCIVCKVSQEVQL